PVLLVEPAFHREEGRVALVVWRDLDDGRSRESRCVRQINVGRQFHTIPHRDTDLKDRPGIPGGREPCLEPLARCHLGHAAPTPIIRCPIPNPAHYIRWCRRCPSTSCHAADYGRDRPCEGIGRARYRVLL